jgi:AcrR family transcriptional regulator
MRKAGSGRRRAGSTAQQTDRRRFIIGHAAKLFADVGYSAATMDDLSEMTGLNKGTLYYYYNSKSDLLYEIISVTHKASHDCIDAARQADNAITALSDLIDRMIDWISQNKDFATILSKEQDYFRDNMTPEQLETARGVHRSYMRKLYGLISNGVEAGLLRPCDVRVMGRAISTMLFYSPSWRLTMGPAAISTQLKRLVLDGLKA